MDRPFRVGVAGVGFGARVHIPSFQAEGVEVVSVFSRRLDRAQETAAKYGIANAYDDFAAMLARDDLDAVSVVTPEAAHHEMTLRALESGKHVLCEKPLTTNAADARGLYDAAKERGLTHMIGHEHRFLPARQRARELIKEGYLGDFRFALIKTVLDRPPLPSGAGYLYGVGSHYVDCLRDWFGEVESVSAEVMSFVPAATNHASETVDDSFIFTLRFVGGGYALVIGSRRAGQGSGESTELYGSDGTLVIPRGPGGLAPPADGSLLGGRTGDEKLAELPIPDRLQPFVDERFAVMPFRMLVRDFVRGVVEHMSPAPNFYDGWRNQQVLDAIRESSDSGVRVTIAI